MLARVAARESPILRRVELVPRAVSQRSQRLIIPLEPFFPHDARLRDVVDARAPRRHEFVHASSTRRLVPVRDRVQRAVEIEHVRARARARRAVARAVARHRARVCRARRSVRRSVRVRRSRLEPRAVDRRDDSNLGASFARRRGRGRRRRRRRAARATLLDEPSRCAFRRARAARGRDASDAIARARCPDRSRASYARAERLTRARTFGRRDDADASRIHQAGDAGEPVRADGDAGRAEGTKRESGVRGGVEEGVHAGLLPSGSALGRDLLWVHARGGDAGGCGQGALGGARANRDG